MSLDAELADRLRDAVVDVLSDRRMLDALVAQADRPLAVSVDEAARLLGCSAKQVRVMVDDGFLARLPGVGTRVLIPRVSIEALIERATAGERVRLEVAS